MFEKRRALMQDWANFVNAPPSNFARVTSIKAAGKSAAPGANTPGQDLLGPS